MITKKSMQKFLDNEYPKRKLVRKPMPLTVPTDFIIAELRRHYSRNPITISYMVLDEKLARKLAAWLVKAADWVEQ